MTERTVRTIEHPFVDAVGQTIGTQVKRHEPYASDVERVAEAAARTGTMIDTNSNPAPRP